MSCYHPLNAIKTFNVENIDTGKGIPKCKVKVLKGEYDPFNPPDLDINQQHIPLPCGRCIGCRLDYSRNWADRMLAEASLYESNYFLTLTYNDDNLPPKRENSPIHSLDKKDAQLFMKKLRNHLSGQKIRFFCAGEYSPTKLRPHMHFILFNCKLDDLKFLRENELKQPYFVSETLSKCWTNKNKESKGFHILAPVTWETCAYVARYVVKKQKGEGASVYDKYNFAPEFSLMSRKPGIGHDFCMDHLEELYSYGSVNLPTQNGAKSIRPNRYYDNLFDIEYPDILDEIKYDRQLAALEYNEVRSGLTSLSYQDLLRSSEINKEATVKALKRKEL